MSGFDFNTTKPIYLQLVDRINAEIVRGKRQPGEKLAAVREYAVEAGVNVNTIQRVYRELETMGIAQVHRGQGTFVTENKQRLQQLRVDMRQTYVAAFISNMNEMGFNMDEIVQSLEEERRMRK